MRTLGADNAEGRLDPEVVDGCAIKRAGKFLTEAEMKDLRRPVSHLFDTAVTGEQWPHIKLAQCAVVHGVELRDDGRTLWGVDGSTGEIVYGTPIGAAA